MSDLIAQYGPSWFVGKFGGSVFVHEDNAYIVTPGTSGWRTRVPCKRLDLQEDGFSVNSVDVALPKDVFTSVALFGVPNLGWRSLDKGRILTYMSRNNSSYHRGLAGRNLLTEEASITRFLRMSANYTNQLSQNAMLRAAALPAFTPLAQGIEMIRREEIISFAVSSTVAVLPLDGERMRVMFKQKTAGIINPDNTMQLSIPELSNYMETLV